MEICKQILMIPLLLLYFVLYINPKKYIFGRLIRDSYLLIIIFITVDQHLQWLHPILVFYYFAKLLLLNTLVVFDQH